MSNNDLLIDDPKITCAPLGFDSDAARCARPEHSRQWTLKGLAPETIEVSRDAAKRSGMKLNAWVSRALEQAATDHSAHGSASATVPGSLNADMINHITEELVRLRAQSEDMRNTVNTMSSVLLKLVENKI